MPVVFRLIKMSPWVKKIVSYDFQKGIRAKKRDVSGKWTKNR